MTMELVYFEGCPGYRKAEVALKTALSEASIRDGFELRLVAVNTDEEAERLEFPGSPTIRVTGKDLFPAEGFGSRPSWRLGCRVYQTSEGLQDHPSAGMMLSRLLWGEEGRTGGQ